MLHNLITNSPFHFLYITNIKKSAKFRINLTPYGFFLVIAIYDPSEYFNQELGVLYYLVRKLRYSDVRPMEVLKTGERLFRMSLWLDAYLYLAEIV